MIIVLTLGCLTLDSMLPFHRGIHCSEVSEETCNPDYFTNETISKDRYWDKICTACDEAYDWDRQIDWANDGRRPNILDEVDEIDVIPPEIVQSVSIDIEDPNVKLDAYFIPANGTVPELMNTTIVYSHGRFAGIDHYIPRIQILYSLGYNIFVWDYRGYGKSQPPEYPDSKEWMSDAVAAFDAAANAAPDSEKLIIYGMSVGTLPAAEMADKRLACAQIFEASTLSNTEKVEDNLSIMLPFSFISSGVLEGDVKLEDTTQPTMLMHGDNDSRTSLRAAQAVFDRLPEDIEKKFILIEGGGHGLGADRYRDGTIYFDGGGLPEQGYSAYGHHLMEFLAQQAPACLSLSSLTEE